MVSLFEEAEKILEGHATDRGLGKERSMKKIVEVFNTLTGKNLTEHDGDIFMVCLKLVRMQRSPQIRDNYIDALNYLVMSHEAIELDDDIRKSLDDYREGRFKQGSIDKLLKDLRSGEDE
jgi:hypothetical protein